jgi:hypothetical protein
VADGSAAFEASPTRREDEVQVPPPTTREPPVEAGDGLLLLPASLRVDWTIVRELPGGGEADVLLVRGPQDVQRVLKVYRRNVTIDVEALRRVTALDRAHLVLPELTGHEGGRHWDLMEFVAGGTLAEHLEQTPGTRLPPGEIIGVVEQLTAALEALHGAHVTHGDVKPANILLRGTAPLRIALSDFGLSKYLGDASKRFTQRAWTFAYAAPESFAGRFSPAQDWWALGMIVRQLATGEVPFAGLAEQVAVHELLIRDIPTGHVEDGRLRLLCRGLLVRDPDQRWTAEQVRAWLAGGSPPVQATVDVRGQRPLKVAGQECWTRADAARALATHWDLAQRLFLSRIGSRADPGEGWRTLRVWLEQFDEDVEERIHLIDRVLTAPDVPGEIKMLHLVRWLDPTLPPTYRGLSMLPQDLGRLAQDAAERPGLAATVVDELWRHRCCELLGDELAAVDRRWRESVAHLDRIAATPRLPPDAVDALTRAATVNRALLLRAAADDEHGTALAELTASARADLPEDPQWMVQLDVPAHPETSAAKAVAFATLLPVALAHHQEAVRRRDAGRIQWEHEERYRLAGRTRAAGYVAAAAGLWLVVAMTAWTAGLAATAPSTDPDPTVFGVVHPDLLIVLTCGVVWLLNVGAELLVARQLGAFYHPRFSAWSGMLWLGRRAPDGWDALRRGVNAARTLGAAAPALGGLSCCLGCLITLDVMQTLLAAIGTVYGLGTACAALAHLIWAAARSVRFRRMHRARRRALLGENDGGVPQ